jgi:hypothetical protein
VRHVPDGTLRRLRDEPFAVRDREVHHVASCARCRARRDVVASDASAAEELFSFRATFSGTDLAWARHQGKLMSHSGGGSNAVRAPKPRYWRLMGTSLGTGVAVAGAGAVLAGVAAAATLTTIFAPTTVAPVPVSSADVRALAGLLGIQSPSELIGFSRPSGSQALPFGTLRWTSTGGRRVASLSEAEASTGLDVSLPSSLPGGVGAPDGYFVVPKVTATVVLGPAAGQSLSGSSLVATIGPGIGVTYAGTTSGTSIYPLAVLTMARPLATSTGHHERTGKIPPVGTGDPARPGSGANPARQPENDPSCSHAEGSERPLDRDR